MQGTYYETHPILSILLCLVFLVIICITFKIESNNANRKGTDLHCIACKNRGYKYKPKHCNGHCNKKEK